MSQNTRSKIFLGIFLTLYHISILSATYNQACSDYSRNCDNSKFMICLHGKCQCASPDTMQFDKAANSCVTNIFENCFVNQSLTLNKVSTHSIVRSETYQLSRKTPCVFGAYCNPSTQNVCICNNSTKADKTTGRCIVSSKVSEKAISSHGELCTRNKHCMAGLKCKSGRCLCPFEEMQTHNGTHCLTLVDGPCSGNEDNKKFATECTMNAKCVKVNWHFSCKCESGYLETRDRRCSPGYKKPCDIQSNVENASCGNWEGILLECVDGICDCPSELYTYSDREHRCKGLVGSACPSELNGKGYLHGFCVNGATCDRGSNPGFCECEENYKEALNRTCKR